MITINSQKKTIQFSKPYDGGEYVPFREHPLLMAYQYPERAQLILVYFRTEEPLDVRGVLEDVRVQHFDGGGLVGMGVEPLVDLAHCAPPQDASELVSTEHLVAVATAAFDADCFLLDKKQREQ